MRNCALYPPGLRRFEAPSIRGRTFSLCPGKINPERAIISPCISTHITVFCVDFPGLMYWRYTVLSERSINASFAYCMPIAPPPSGVSILLTSLSPDMGSAFFSISSGAWSGMSTGRSVYLKNTAHTVMQMQRIITINKMTMILFVLRDTLATPSAH